MSWNEPEADILPGRKLCMKAVFVVLLVLAMASLRFCEETNVRTPKTHHRESRAGTAQNWKTKSSRLAKAPWVFQAMVWWKHQHINGSSWWHQLYDFQVRLPHSIFRANKKRNPFVIWPQLFQNEISENLFFVGIITKITASTVISHALQNTDQSLFEFKNFLLLKNPQIPEMKSSKT